MTLTTFKSGTIKKVRYSSGRRRLVVWFPDGKISKINDVDPAQYQQLVSAPDIERYTFYKNAIDPLTSHPRRFPLLYFPRLTKIAIAMVAAYLLLKYAFIWIDRTAHTLK